MRLGHLLLAGAAMLFATAADAREPFSVTLDVEGQSGTASFTRIEDAYRILSTAGLRSLVSSYTDTSAASAQINLRGVAAQGIFTEGSPALRIIVPSAGVDVEFNGSTRDESRRLFEAWLRARGSSEVNRVLRAAAATTPIDPVAGNPNAAMNQFVASDFGRAVESATGGMAGTSLGVRFGSFTAADYNTRSVSLPINQSFRLSPRDTIEIDVPLSWTDTEGARTYAANIGILYRRQVFDWWTLQPSFRIGGVGSADLGGGSGVYSAALNSTLRFDLPADFRLVVANGVSYVATFPASFGSYSIDYDLQNVVYRNGIILSRDLGIEVAGRPLIGSIFAVDTRFTGDAVYIQNYQEFGAFAQLGRDSRFRLGFTYLTGDRGVRGFAFSTGVEF